jgi:hypothetical protein
MTEPFVRPEPTIITDLDLHENEVYDYGDLFNVYKQGVENASHCIPPLETKLEKAAKVALAAMQRYVNKRADYETFETPIKLLQEALG